MDLERKNRQLLDSKTKGGNPVKLGCTVLERSAWMSVYRISDFTVRHYFLKSQIIYIDREALAKQGDNALGSVCLFVSPFVLYCLNRLNYDSDVRRRFSIN